MKTLPYEVRQSLRNVDSDDHAKAVERLCEDYDSLVRLLQAFVKLSRSLTPYD